MKKKIAQKKAAEKAAELEKAQQELEAAEKELKEEEAEKALFKEIASKITKICDDNNMFCGAVLTADDIATIVSLAIQAKENIKIPFRLYFNE